MPFEILGRTNAATKIPGAVSRCQTSCLARRQLQARCRWGAVSPWKLKGRRFLRASKLQAKAHLFREEREALRGDEQFLELCLAGPAFWCHD